MRISIVPSFNMALVEGVDVRICCVQDALDLMASVRYETDCVGLFLDRSSFCGEFFDLGSGLLGEVLQKFVNYGFRLVILGDFGDLSSKAWVDFIRESNRGDHVGFWSGIGGI